MASSVAGNAFLQRLNVHVIKWNNDKLSQFRRDLHRESPDKRHEEELKGPRWLPLKKPANLDAGDE